MGSEMCIRDRSIGDQVGVQAIGILSTFVYTAIVTFIILKIVNAMVGLRVDEDVETQGLDINLHNERGYNDI